MDTHFAGFYQEEVMLNVPFLIPQPALLQPLIPTPIKTEPSISDRDMPSSRIVEEPASTSMRFRYKCETSEGRSAGSIPGARSTPQCKTYPTIEVTGYTGTVCVMVSCVTDEQPYSAHPHQLVGRDCHMGFFKVFTEVGPEKPFIVFNNLGIQCVKKKDVEKSLTLRKRFRVGPCDAPVAKNIKLNVLRLCFQVFLVSKNEKGEDQLTPLRPLVTKNVISDKKAMNELIIHKLSHCSASVAGGQDMILLCDKVPKDEIKIQFYETQNGVVVWKEDALFSPVNVHKQVAINFRTPKYKDQSITQPIKVYIILYNAKTKIKSKPRPFELRRLDSDITELKRSRLSGENECSCLLKRLQQTLRENPALLSSFIMSPQSEAPFNQANEVSQPAPLPPTTFSPAPQLLPVPKTSPVPQMSQVPQMLPVLQMSSASQMPLLNPQISPVYSNMYAPGPSNIASTSPATNTIPNNIVTEQLYSNYDDVSMSILIQGSLSDSANLQQMQDKYGMEGLTDSFSKFFEL